MSTHSSALTVASRSEPPSACEGSLFRLDERIDHYYDGRKGGGFEFEIQSVSEDIAVGRLSSALIPLEASLRVQRKMDRIRCQFPASAQPMPG